MDLRQLEYFVAAAKVEHFTRAAMELNVVQSALSSAIKALEAELGAQLFIRTTRRVRLTSAGRALLEKAVTVLEAADDARRTVHDIGRGDSGKLSIGTVHGLPAFLDLPALLAQYHEAYPRVEVRLVQGGAVHLIDKLRAGIVDLAFLPMLETSEEITTTMIACEDMVAVCAPSHPLAGAKKISLAELGRHAFVDFQPDWGTRRLIDDAFRGTGIERKTAFEVSDLNTLFDLVSRGLGIALVPESVARDHKGLVVNCAPVDTEMCWEVVVAHMTGTTSDAAPAKFLSLIGSREV